MHWSSCGIFDFLFVCLFYLLHVFGQLTGLVKKENSSLFFFSFVLPNHMMFQIAETMPR